MTTDDKEDKEKIFSMLYGGVASIEVAFRHRESDIVHRVQSTAQAIGVTYCGIKVMRSNAHQWVTANFEMVTCIGCIGSEPFEPVLP